MSWTFWKRTPAPDPEALPDGFRYALKLALADTLEALAISPDGKKLAGGGGHEGGAMNGVSLWWMDTGEPVCAAAVLDERVYSVEWALDSTALAIGTEGSVYVWEILSGKVRRIASNLPGSILHLSWSPAGDALVIAASGERSSADPTSEFLPGAEPVVLVADREGGPRPGQSFRLLNRQNPIGVRWRNLIPVVAVHDPGEMIAVLSVADRSRIDAIFSRVYGAQVAFGSTDSSACLAVQQVDHQSVAYTTLGKWPWTFRMDRAEHTKEFEEIVTAVGQSPLGALGFRLSHHSLKVWEWGGGEVSIPCVARLTNIAVHPFLPKLAVSGIHRGTRLQVIEFDPQRLGFRLGQAEYERLRAPAGQAGEVFLSYRTEDRAWAARLAEGLRAAGVGAWFDAERLQAGDLVGEVIQQRIARCHVMLVLCGPDGLGPFQRDEVRWAQTGDSAGRLTVVPVLLPGCRRPDDAYLAQRRWLAWPGCQETPGAEPAPVNGMVAEIQRLLLRPATIQRSGYAASTSA